MNNTSGNSRLLNSLLPQMGSTNMNTKNIGINSKNIMSSDAVYYATSAILVVIVIGVFYYFQTAISTSWTTAVELVNGYFNPSLPSAISSASDMTTSSVTNVVGSIDSPLSQDSDMAPVVNKVLPPSSGLSEVFNIASNRFTYYDAEPLCKAMGAELATYDQVKEAWSKGADWCNYGWVKGQMAVYPTSDSTYAKLQAGPEGDRMSCGTTGINGGYFDNPEMRYGVTCYGKKPSENAHDESAVAKGAPVSPDAVAFNQKVSKFKSEVDTIAVSPFNGTKWNN